ncbi:MAG: choice-of-anchor tandem repeat GloVer-containing protein [Bryobacteraceae bacterium]
MTAYRVLMALTLCAAPTVPSPAQTFTPLASFDGSNGSEPYLLSLVQGTDGMFYGTTRIGGAYGSGTVFKVSTSGVVTTLHSFCAKSNCPDGRAPTGSLVLGTDGNLYGTTEYGGGAKDDGTVFKITSAGELTTLISFDGTNGAEPVTGLVQGGSGNFFGTTYGGGASDDGTVFQITPSGTLTTLHSFGYTTDGAFPYGALLEASNGNLYGTTYEGGATGYGTLFEIAANGTLNTLYTFDSTDGAYPEGGLIETTSGKLCGTTYKGGSGGDGAIFDATLAGAVTPVHSFTSNGGSDPVSGVIQATDGNLYGTTTTTGSGGSGYGTVFRMTAGGTFTTLHTFADTDGAYVYDGLVQGTDGSFYGVTEEGGSSNNGTVFKLSVGLGAFVKTMPTSGKAGTAVTILGSDLTGATRVAFNGVMAAFTVNSTGTAISTTVPAAATTGTVKVVTPSGTLSSNVPFRVP